MPEEKTNKQKIKRDKTKTFTSLKMKQKASKKKGDTPRRSSEILT